MPGVSFPNVTPGTARTILVLMIVGTFLSGCASYSVVPVEELEAGEQQRQELQVRQQQLLNELETRTAVQHELETLLTAEEAKLEASEQRQANLEHELETRLASESVKREALEQRQVELERELQQQQSTATSLIRLEANWQQWREQDQELQLEGLEAAGDDDASLYLLILEKKAQIARLTVQLDETILEVVRAKAKLRSLESKAEAASDLAEAEIEVESLKSQGTSWEIDLSVANAEQLTELGAEEFDLGNYGGSLYLTGQAKSLIKLAQARSMNQEMSLMMDGEVSFALPLSLELLGESDIREGPDSQFKVLFSLDKGAALIGHSYKGQWVRVKSEDGESGWVFYKKLASSY